MITTTNPDPVTLLASLIATVSQLDNQMSETSSAIQANATFAQENKPVLAALGTALGAQLAIAGPAVQALVAQIDAISTA